MPKLLNLNVNLHTWWCIQWMIDKITNKDTITSVKKDKWTKIKACWVPQTLYLSLWVDIWAAPFILLDKVNSLVSDHPCCTTKWSLPGGGRLWENSRKYEAQTELINVIT